MKCLRAGISICLYVLFLKSTPNGKKTKTVYIGLKKEQNKDKFHKKSQEQNSSFGNEERASCVYAAHTKNIFKKISRKRRLCKDTGEENKKQEQKKEKMNKNGKTLMQRVDTFTPAGVLDKNKEHYPCSSTHKRQN